MEQDKKMLRANLKQDDLINDLPAVKKDISKNFLAYCKLFRTTIKEIIGRDMDKLETGRLHKMAFRYSYQKVVLDVCDKMGIPKKTLEQMADKVEREEMKEFLIKAINDKENN